MMDRINYSGVGRKVLVTIILVQLTICCRSVASARLYEFGHHVPYETFKLANGNSVCSGIRHFGAEMTKIYGKSVGGYQVCSYGGIFFGYEDISSSFFTSDSFPMNEYFIIIAPFWADVDTRSGGGNVWIVDIPSTDTFQGTANSQRMADFQRAANQINNAFPYLYSINSSNIKALTIATWDGVGYFDEKIDKKNTFQCVIAATDNEKTFAIFLYSQIQWSKPTEHRTPNPYAQVGFTKGDENTYHLLSESGTSQVRNIVNGSNVNSDEDYKGVYVFDITGNNDTILEPKKCTHTSTGTEYRSGEQFKVGCSTSCTCKPGGILQCMEAECLYTSAGRVNGDPHYETFDSIHYNFQGIGEYVLTKMCSDDKFIITAKNIASTRTSHASLAYEVTIYVPDRSLTIVLGRGNITINSELQTNTTANETVYEHEGIKVQLIGGHPHVFFTDGLKLFWDGDFRVTIHVSDHLKGKLCGLLGNYNNAQDDDLMKPDGTIANSFVEFGNSWQINSTDHKRDVQDEFLCSDDPSIISEAHEKCSVIKKGVFSACNKLLNSSQFIENCKFDYRCCGDNERERCYCDNLATYAAACADVGAQPSNWRSAYCSVECPAGMVYQQCGTLCPPTCDNYDEDCVGGCAEGCFCPIGQVLFEGNCVDPIRCKACTFMNVTYEHGEQMQPNCSSRCTCRNREFHCQSQSCSKEGSTCIVYGNSHYQTFDFHHYDFQGDCELILVTPCNNNEFSIIVKSTAVNHFISSITEVTILLTNQELHIVLGEGDGGTITIDNVLQPNVGNTVIMLSKEVEILRAGGHPRVILNDYNITIFWNGKDRVQVSAANVWKNRLCGLCGNYNDKASDDLMSPNNKLIRKTDDFIKSWTTSPNKSCDLLASAPGCFGFIRVEAERRCRHLQSGVFEQCNRLLDPTPFIRDCVFDYCNCKDTKEICYCNVLATYASACSSIGITITNWREFYCSPQCPENMIYHQCGSFCSKTCDNSTATCYSGCAEGCFCFDGYFTDDYGKCRKNCPIYTNEGNEYFIGFFNNRFGRLHEPSTILPILWITTQEFTPVKFTVFTNKGLLAKSIAYLGKTIYIKIPLEYIVVDDLTEVNIAEQFKGISIKAEGNKKLVVFGQNEQVASNDAFLALPINPIPRKIHHEYILISVHGDFGTTLQSKDSVGLIIGVQNKTEVTIIPSAAISIIVNKLAPTNNIFSNVFSDQLNTITIDKYQTVYLQVRNQDISGTRVIANKPISVFSGHECANIPRDSQPCDMLMEQIPPVDTWGNEIVTIPFKTRNGDVVKVIASQDSTTVFVTKTGILNSKASNTSTFTLNAGDYKELLIKDFSIIKSNNPIAVFQFSRSYRSDNVIISDPFMLYVPPYKQYLNSYTIATAPFNPQSRDTVSTRTAYVNYTNIAVPKKYFDQSMLIVNNQTIDASSFKPIKYSDGSVWGYGAQIVLKAGAQMIRHQDPNAKFLLLVYGFSNQMSYGYTGGLKLGSHTAARSCNVRQISGSVVVNARTMVVKFSADDLGATFRCKLDKKRFKICTSPWKQENITKGNHLIKVEAKCPKGGKRVRQDFRFQIV